MAHKGNWDEGEHTTGLAPRDFEKYPLGVLDYAPRLSLRVLPRTAWRDAIARKDQEQSWLMSRFTPTPYDQGDCEHSAAFALAMATSLALQVAGQPAPTELSPLSLVRKPDTPVGCMAALKHLVNTGIEEPAQVAGAVPKLYTMRAYDLDVGNFDEVVTCALRNVPMVWADSGWAYAFCAGLQVRCVDGEIEILCVASRGTGWGQGGFLWVGERGLHHPTEAYGIVAP